MLEEDESVEESPVKLVLVLLYNIGDGALGIARPSSCCSFIRIVDSSVSPRRISFLFNDICIESERGKSDTREEDGAAPADELLNGVETE